MSNLLRRALKTSIVPAILMIAGKLFGLFLASILYDLNLQLDNDIAGIFSVQLFYTDATETVLANSVSNLVMISLLVMPVLYYILKTSIYQSSINNPRTIVKMTKLNISKWITKDDSSFLKTFIWSSFLCLASIITIAHSLQGLTYAWIGILAAFLTLFSIWGAIKTFETETAKIYPRDNKYL